MPFPLNAQMLNKSQSNAQVNDELFTLMVVSLSHPSHAACRLYYFFWGCSAYLPLCPRHYLVLLFNQIRFRRSQNPNYFYNSAAILRHLSRR